MFTWTDQYSVGNPEIDAQHRHFFDIVNRFEKADPADKAEAEALFDALDDYTRVHFADEEALLEKIGFPGLERHRHVHGLFFDQVKELRVHFQEGAFDLAFAGELVTRWLSIHIRMMDKTWAEWARATELARNAEPRVEDDNPANTPGASSV